MVEWMGQNFDVFPGFQKIPCYAQYCVIQCIGLSKEEHWANFRLFVDWQKTRD